MYGLKSVRHPSAKSLSRALAGAPGAPGALLAPVTGQVGCR